MNRLIIYLIDKGLFFIWWIYIFVFVRTYFNATTGGNILYWDVDRQEWMLAA